MKKVLLLAFALVVSSILFVSCDKDDDKNIYYYLTIIKTTLETNSAGIDKALTSRLNKEYVLSYSDAKAEWNSFLNAVDESAVKIASGEYYTVKFCKMKEKDGRLVEDSVVGEKTWKGN